MKQVPDMPSGAAKAAARKRRPTLALAALALALAACEAPLVEHARWIGTWQTAPVGIPAIRRIGPHRLPAPMTVAGTIRYRLRVSQGGERLRLVFANEFNTGPMTVASASVGLAGDALDAVPGSLRRITFAGEPAVTLPVGGTARSDPIDLPVAALGDLVVSVHAPGGISWLPTDPPKEVDPGMAEGADATFSERWPADRRVHARPMVSAVEVLTARPTRVVVALGDSITDGSVDARTGDRGWPGALARRVAGQGISVVNAGINSNRLLKSGDFFGPAGPARLERDVFSVPGVTHLIVLEGINDIGMGAPDSWLGESAPVRAEELAAALREIIARARQRGIKVIGATILPFAGAPYYADEKERTRVAVNNWIRSSGEFDGVVDFDAAVRDPERPERLKREFDAGDHLHPSHEGCREMAAAVDLKLLSL